VFCHPKGKNYLQKVLDNFIILFLQQGPLDRAKFVVRTFFTEFPPIYKPKPGEL
jgi:hypothetical protein